MKSVAIGMVMIWSLLLGSVFLLTIEGKSVRKQELETVVSHVVKRVGPSLLAKEGNDPHTLSLALQEQMQNRLSSDGEVTVTVTQADSELGLLAVTVMESYKQPDGKMGTYEIERVLLKDVQGFAGSDEGDGTLCTISFSLEGTDWRTYQMAAGDWLRLPVPPVRNTSKFSGWGNGLDGEQLAAPSQLVQIKEDCCYVGYYHSLNEDENEK